MFSVQTLGLLVLFLNLSKTTTMFKVQRLLKYLTLKLHMSNVIQLFFSCTSTYSALKHDDNC